MGAIQLLRNAVGVGVSAFPEKSIMKVYGSTLLALQGGGWGLNSQEKAVWHELPRLHAAARLTWQAYVDVRKLENSSV